MTGSVISIGLAIRPRAEKDHPQVARQIPPPEVVEIGPERQKPKKVLRTFFRSEIQATDSTLRGCSANRAATKRCAIGTGRPVEESEQQNRIENMQDQARPVMAAGVSPEKSPVEDVRQPCQWMPVPGLMVEESPLQGLPGQTGLEMGVLKQVNVVVVIDESNPEHSIDDKNGCGQKKGKKNSVLVFSI